MRLFNRILLIVVLLAVIVFAGFSAGYAVAGQDDYSAAHLPAFLALQEAAVPVQQWLQANFEAQLIPFWLFAILVVVGLAGLALLAYELLPRRSRHLKLGPGLRVDRELIEEEAERVASDDQSVLASSARLVPRRDRSKLAVALKVRRGEDTRQAEARVADAIADRIADKGQVRIARAKVKASTQDPRGSKRRVR